MFAFELFDDNHSSSLCAEAVNVTQGNPGPRQWMGTTSDRRRDAAHSAASLLARTDHSVVNRDALGLGTALMAAAARRRTVCGSELRLAAVPDRALGIIGDLSTRVGAGGIRSASGPTGLTRSDIAAGARTAHASSKSAYIV